MQLDFDKPRPRRRLILAALLAAVALVTACANLGPRTVTLSQADLQTLIERQFPRDRRLLELIDVNLARPVIRLAPERNRITTALDLSAIERVSGRTLRGSLTLDHALRYEASDATVRLAQVRVDELKLDVGGTALSGQAARLGGLLAEHLLDDMVLYRASDEKREVLRRAGIDRGEVAITSRGVELRFSEAR